MILSFSFSSAKRERGRRRNNFFQCLFSRMTTTTTTRDPSGGGRFGWIWKNAITPSTYFSLWLSPGGPGGEKPHLFVRGDRRRIVLRHCYSYRCLPAAACCQICDLLPVSLTLCCYHPLSTPCSISLPERRMPKPPPATKPRTIAHVNPTKPIFSSTANNEQRARAVGSQAGRDQRRASADQKSSNFPTFSTIWRRRRRRRSPPPAPSSARRRRWSLYTCMYNIVVFGSKTNQRVLNAQHTHRRLSIYYV